MYDRIIVPLDGSPFAEQALPLAATIARRAGGVLTLVRVHVPPPAPGPGQDASLASFDLDAADRASTGEYLQRMAAHTGEGAALRTGTTLVDASTPAEAICREAAETGAAMIVMSTHGRTGVRRALLGSVADGVLRRATVPVLLWHPADVPSPEVPALEHVLVALDGSTWAEQAVPPAAALAEALGARLTLARVVAHVVRPVATELAAISATPYAGVTYVPPEVDYEATMRELERSRGYLAKLAERVRASHRALPVGVQAVTGEDPGAVVARLAGEVHADVVALATHGRGASRLVVGSTVDHVLRARRGATLVVRPSLPDARG